MNNNTKRFVAITGIGLALIMPINKAFSDESSKFFAKLSAEWWQWAVSIPTSVNPQTPITALNLPLNEPLTHCTRLE